MDSHFNGRRPVPPRHLSHVVLRTRQLDSLVEWWSTLLAARVVYRNEWVCFLTYDSEHHRIALVSSPKVVDSPPASVGLDHIGFTYGTLDDLLFTHDRMRGAGIEPHQVINHGASLSIYYRDPDGNRADCFVDRFDTVEDAYAYFDTPEFHARPMGYEVDLADIARRYRDGTPVRDVLAIPAGAH